VVAVDVLVVGIVGVAVVAVAVDDTEVGSVDVVPLRVEKGPVSPKAPATRRPARKSAAQAIVDAESACRLRVMRAIDASYEPLVVLGATRGRP
jgi:hypothetical protein